MSHWRREDDDRKAARGNQLNKVFYAEQYHPIQAGSIDGTDIVPHDNAVSRALLCSSASLYDPFGDSKATGDPYCTLFVGRLSPMTTEKTLQKAMGKYGTVKSLRLVRHIVTGESRGYAFVEYEKERDMRRAYKDAHRSTIDDREILVDYCRQLLMPGWIPRRLGGGLSGRKESGQLRFGGRERPFRAPLQEVPYESLKKLGIPLPPEGRYVSRFEVPSPPRRKKSASEEKCGTGVGAKDSRERERRLKEDDSRSESRSRDNRNSKRHRHHRDRRAGDEYIEKKKRRHRRNYEDEASNGADIDERWPMSCS